LSFFSTQPSSSIRSLFHPHSTFLLYSHLSLNSTHSFNKCSIVSFFSPHILHTLILSSFQYLISLSSFPHLNLAIITRSFLLSLPRYFGSSYYYYFYYFFILPIVPRFPNSRSPFLHLHISVSLHQFICHCSASLSHSFYLRSCIPISLEICLPLFPYPFSYFFPFFFQTLLQNSTLSSLYHSLLKSYCSLSC
jgi:hypothetical protein